MRARRAVRASRVVRLRDPLTVAVDQPPVLAVERHGGAARREALRSKEARRNRDAAEAVDVAPQVEELHRGEAFTERLHGFEARLDHDDAASVRETVHGDGFEVVVGVDAREHVRAIENGAALEFLRIVDPDVERIGERFECETQPPTVGAAHERMFAIEDERLRLLVVVRVGSQCRAHDDARAVGALLDRHDLDLGLGSCGSLAGAREALEEVERCERAGLAEVAHAEPPGQRRAAADAREEECGLDDAFLELGDVAPVEVLEQERHVAARERIAQREHEVVQIVVDHRSLRAQSVAESGRRTARFSRAASTLRRRPEIHVHDPILFDLDGTLIDSIELIRRSYAHAMREHRGVAHDEREFVSGLGRPLKWQFARHASDPAEVDAMIATYRKFNVEHHDALVSVYPGAVEAVQRLVERGAKLAIVTSKLNASARHGLVHCGYDVAWFRAIVGVDDVTEHKPHPRPVQRALELLGVEAAGAVMVGDSPHDLASGRAAGTRTAAVSWGPFPHEELRATAPDLWLETPHAIAHL